MAKNTRSTTKTAGLEAAPYKPLSAKQVARLNAVNAKYNEELARTRPVYPEVDPSTITDILLGNVNPLQAVGGLENIKALGWDNHQLDLTLDDLEDYRGGRRRNRNRQRGGGNKGGGRPSGGTLMNPQIVLAAIQKKIAAVGAKPVGNTGEIIWGAQNFEMLTQAKAKWFMDSYKEYIPLAHVWLCSEIGKDGLEEIARQTGYTAYCSADNSRGNQAVGILIHPRLKMVTKTIYDEVANVQGVNDLRPLLVLDLEDTNPVTEEDRLFWAGVLHLKSMRGGVATTGAVRYQQCQIVADKLKDKKTKGRVGGDMNMIFPGVKDYMPLTAVNLLLVDPADTRATHIGGSRLDAFFTFKYKSVVKGIRLLDWFSDSTIGRGLTDHAALSV